MTGHLTVVDCDDADLLHARANVVLGEQIVAKCEAEVGSVVAALDALREVRRRFPGVAPIDKAVTEVEYGPLPSAHERLRRAKTSLAKAQTVWASYESATTGARS